MTLRIERFADDTEQWNDYVSRADHASVFHRHEGLALIADHTDTTLYPLVGYKGQEPVGVLPVFERSVGPLTLVESPPDGMEVFSLGPVLTNREQLKQRKIERRNRRFVDECLGWIDDHLGPDVVHLRSVERYTDLRPFQDRGYDVTPYYTYVVDLDRTTEDLLASFSSDARSNIRNADDREYEVEVGDREAAAAVIEQVRARMAALEEPYPLTPSTGRELYDRFSDDVVRPYVLSVDGERAGGMIALEHDDTVYRWQGGAKTSVDFPVNDVLDWHVITDAMDRDMTRYDLVGANLSRTARYKAKFGPDPVPYYGAMKRRPSVEVLTRLRQQLPVVG